VCCDTIEVLVTKNDRRFEKAFKALDVRLD